MLWLVFLRESCTDAEFGDRSLVAGEKSSFQFIVSRLLRSLISGISVLLATPVEGI